MFWFRTCRLNPVEYLHAMEFLAQKTPYIIERGRKLEAKGRDIASRNTELIGYEDEDWINDLEIYHRELANYIMRTSPLLQLDLQLYGDLLNMASIIDHGISYAFAVARLTGKPRSVHFLNPREVGEEAVKYGRMLVRSLVAYDELQRKYSGRTGIWLWGNVEPEKYTWAGYVNDLTSCFHQLLIFMEHYIGSYGIYQSVSEKVQATVKASPYLVELAQYWEKSLKVLNRYSLLEREDYEATMAYVRENDMDLRVGNAPGHLTHVELRPLGIAVSYYDFDENVRNVLELLARDYGCNVVAHNRMVGQLDLFCPRLTSASEKFMKYVLPFATSMDFRIAYPREYWSKIISNLEELLGKYSASISPGMVEYHNCKWFIENVLVREVG